MMSATIVAIDIARLWTVGVGCTLSPFGVRPIRAAPAWGVILDQAIDMGVEQLLNRQNMLAIFFTVLAGKSANIRHILIL